MIDLERLLGMPLIFARTGDGEHPYHAKVDDKTITIRINDFPAEPLYSVLVEGESIGDLEDWPSAWIEPSLHVGGRNN